MTDYFFDSSGVIKRYIDEVGSKWIRSVMPTSIGHRIHIAQITPIEVVSGVMRRRREGSITPRTARALRLLVDRHTKREYVVVRLTENIALMAEDLLEKYPLRGADAVQLASAIEINTVIAGIGLSPLIFVSADQRLLAAAVNEGLMTDDPNLHP
ncbi:MAG: type II toxin-antitoxin system VapC family toxin [Chitinophagaceae bacterium]|nr:type II toxin-antitoxin system VapC family toxin [Anaerolineae bacterium]